MREAMREEVGKSFYGAPEYSGIAYGRLGVWEFSAVCGPLSCHKQHVGRDAS